MTDNDRMLFEWKLEKKEIWILGEFREKTTERQVENVNVFICGAPKVIKNDANQDS